MKLRLHSRFMATVGLVGGILSCGGLAQSGTEARATEHSPGASAATPAGSNASTAAGFGVVAAPRAAKETAVRSRTRVSKPDLLLVIRDFRSRLGRDANLYYLVNPPGGATREEEADVEKQIVRFLRRLDKDPTLDIPTRWIRDLKDYDLTSGEWDVIEKYFRAALTDSSLPDPVRRSLDRRFASLRFQVLSTV